MNMSNKKQKRPPRELFRSWLRNSSEGNSTNNSRPSRLIRNGGNVSTPVEIAVSNHLIIENILKHVTDPKDLLSCRLVSTNWTPMATTRLIQSGIQCKGFYFYYIPNCYRSANGQLSELIDCVKNSTKFPTTSFAFRAGDMRSEDAKQFLTLIGTSVKTLTLDAIDNATLCGKMNLTDILSRMPNLRTLIFKGGSYYDSTPTRRLALPALKSVQISCQYSNVKDIEYILRGASNLEMFDGAWRLDDVGPIVVTNKIHTIKRWCPSKFPFPSGLVRLVTASESELKLRELVVNIREPLLLHSNGISAKRLWKYFLRLLNANTIQKLVLHCSKYPADALFPLNMDSVKELNLMPLSNPGILSHFPIGTNLNATFPHLDTLSLYDELYHVCCAGTKWDNCFPLSNAEWTVGNLPSVTTLNLRQESVSIRMLRVMKKICPNVRHLGLCIHEELDKNRLIEELCGEWRNLKTLSIDLKFKNDELVSLDSAFTGLKKESLKALKDDQLLTEQEKLKKVEDTRYTLWIGNICGLVKLNIRYDVPYYTSRSKKTIFIPFTEYSGLYAFNLMDNLKVNLHYRTQRDSAHGDDLKIALASVSPFATISRL